MSAFSSRKSDSYGKDSFDDDHDSSIEAEELDLDNDSMFGDDEIIAAALDFYDSNFKLNKLLKSKDKGKELSHDENEDNEEEAEEEEEEEEEEDLNKMTQPELPEINFDDIDLEPKYEPKYERKLSKPVSCREIDDEIDEHDGDECDEDDVQIHHSDNAIDENTNEKLLSNRSEASSTETGSIKILVSSRRPSSFNSDSRYSLSFDERASSTSIPKKANSRLNLSFSNDRVREIDRHNKILLQKILTKKPVVEGKKKPTTNKPVKESFLFNRTSSAAINRKKEQNKIDYENQILKRKLEAIALGKKRKNRLS